MSQLLERAGYVAHNYTTDNFLQGAEFLWKTAHRLENPTNLFPVVPHRGLQWSRSGTPDDLATKVLRCACLIFSPRSSYLNAQGVHLREENTG